MITRVRLANFKCFEAITLPLGPLTLLSGANSVGKSTVLQSLLLLRQTQRRGNLVVGERAVLNGDLVKLGGPYDTLREGAGSSPLEIELVWDQGTTFAWSFLPKRRSERLDGGEDLVLTACPADDAWREHAPFKGCRFVSADRIGPCLSFPMSEIVVLDENDVGPRGEFYAHYLAEYGDRPMPNPALSFPGIDIGVEAPKAASSKLRHEVEAWLGLLAPGVRIDIAPQTGIDLIQLTFKFPGQTGLTEPRRPTHVGFGLSYVLPVLVAILSTKPGDLVLIENPEAHLHPRAQRLIVELLTRAASSGTQIIVETHSDHVLNGARLAVRQGRIKGEDVTLHFFGKSRTMGEPELCTPKVQPTGALTHWPEGFFDEWDRALDDLLM